MNHYLKLAGLCGVGLGVVFAIGGIIIAASGWDAEKVAPFIVSVILGSVIVFGGCLILTLNDIATALKQK